MSNNKDPLLLGAAIYTFDITSGDAAERAHPDADALVLAADVLSALAIPEGAHNVPEDHVHIITRDPATGEQLYGLAYFHNRRDPSAPRGAIMKSLLVLARRPYFGFFLPILKAGLLRYLDSDSSDETVLPTIVSRLNELSTRTQDTLTIWQQTFPVDMPSLPADQLGGASLLALVQRFREDTMLIWWALLLQLRVLFSGQPTGAVGACCLAAPLLAAPLHGFVEVTSPYVPLSHPEPVEAVHADGRYICGVTNPMFGQKRRWFDALATLNPGSVSGPLVDERRVRVSGAQRSFIKNVLTAVERDGRGEAWVRVQFRQHTEALLLELHMAEEQGRTLRLGGAAKVIEKELWRLTESDMYKRWVASRASAATEASGSSTAAEGDAKTSARTHEWYRILAAPDAAALPTSERSKLLFNLHSALRDLADIDTLVDAGAVRALSQDLYLRNDSSQVRKYATGVLATLCSTVRGQVACLTADLLPILLSLLADPMPAVSAAAANALCKSATLFVGAQAIVGCGLLPILTRLMLTPPTDELLLRTLLASTLLQVYRHLPDAPRIPNAEAEVAQLLEEAVAAKELALLLMQLLDTWGHPLTLATPGLSALLIDLPAVEQHVRAIANAADGLGTRTHAVALLQTELAQRRWMCVPLVLGGAIEELEQTACIGQAMLSRMSLLTLALLADSHCGLSRLLQSSLLTRLVSTLTPAVSPPYGFAVSRLLEVVAQHPAGHAQLIAVEAPAALVGFALTCLPKRGRGSLCVPAIGALAALVKPLALGAAPSPTVISLLEPFVAIADVSDLDAHEALWALLDAAQCTGRSQLRPPSAGGSAPADALGRQSAGGRAVGKGSPLGATTATAAPAAKMETARM